MNASDERVLALIARRHGEIIDVRRQPEAVLDLLRRFGPAVSDPPPTWRARVRRRAGRVVRRAQARLRRPRAGRTTPHAGVETSIQPQPAEILKEVLALRRRVEELGREVAGRAADADPAAPR